MRNESESAKAKKGMKRKAIVESISKWKKRDMKTQGKSNGLVEDHTRLSTRWVEHFVVRARAWSETWLVVLV